MGIVCVNMHQGEPWIYDGGNGMKGGDRLMDSGCGRGMAGCWVWERDGRVRVRGLGLGLGFILNDGMDVCLLDSLASWHYLWLHAAT